MVDTEIAMGSAAPDFELESAQGPTVKLSDYRDRQNVVVWFSRGFTCPFCRRYMAQLGQAYEKFAAANAEVLLIGPNAVKPARTYFQHQPIRFSFLCDPSKRVFNRFGLRDEGILEAGKNTFISFGYAYTHGDGLNTTRLSAQDVFTDGFVGRLGHHALSAIQQGVFIVDRAGIVRYADALHPLATLPPVEALLSHVEKLSNG